VNGDRASGHADRALKLAHRVTGCTPLAVERIVRDSYSHLTFKVHLDNPPYAVAVQIANRTRDSVATSAALLEHLAKDLDVPELLHLEAESDDAAEPALVTTWIEGRSLNRVLTGLAAADLRALARAVAETAAQIWAHRFSIPGRIGVDLAIRPRPAPLRECVDTQVHDQLFDSPGGRALDAPTRESLWSLWQRLRPAVTSEIEERSVLVHGDLAARNLLVREVNPGKWQLSILDWEFAVSGCHLADVGHLLRPYGSVPPVYRSALKDALAGLGTIEQENWHAVAWALDLTALTGPLLHGPGHPDNDAVTGLIRTYTSAPPNYLDGLLP
jgi:aminoglycoside phosphotransferase (APT) family kinase protein